MNRILAGLTVLALIASLDAQTPLTGKWEGTTRNGMRVVLDVKAADEALTGTITRNEQSSPITEGKVSKNTFTFKAVLGDQAENLTGEIGADQLKVWLDRQGPEGAVVFKRVKE